MDSAGSGAHAQATPTTELVAVPKWFLSAVFAAFLSGAIGGLGALGGTYVQVEKAEVAQAMRDKQSGEREKALAQILADMRGEISSLKGEIRALTADRITQTQAEGRHTRLEELIRQHERLPSHPQAQVQHEDLRRRVEALEAATRRLESGKGR